MEAVVFQPAGGELLKIGRLTRSAESARRCEANVVEQDDQYVGCIFRRTQGFDRRKLCVGIFGVVGGQTDMRPIRDGQNCSWYV